jgi:hypothetical protein
VDKVWIVTDNEMCEGGHVIGVYSSLDAASESVAVPPGRAWEIDEDGTWMLDINHVDYYMIEERSIND